MKTEIFSKATNKLYELVHKNKSKGESHFEKLDIKLSKFDFKENEWKFLVENQNKFKTHAIINGENRFYPVYKIEGENLLTNKVNTIAIQNKYSK